MERRGEKERESAQELKQTYKCFIKATHSDPASDILPLAKLLWGPNVQSHKPMRVVSHPSYHSESTIFHSVCAQNLVMVSPVSID